MAEMRNLLQQSIDFIIERSKLSLHQIPDHILDAWIVGIANRAADEYDFERDFIVNLFNEIYESRKESQGINPAEDDHDREYCRRLFESRLKAERERRSKGIATSESIDPFDF